MQLAMQRTVQQGGLFYFRAPRMRPVHGDGQMGKKPIRLSSHASSS